MPTSSLITGLATYLPALLPKICGLTRVGLPITKLCIKKVCMERQLIKIILEISLKMYFNPVILKTMVTCLFMVFRVLIRMEKPFTKRVLLLCRLCADTLAIQCFFLPYNRCLINMLIKIFRLHRCGISLPIILV